MIKNHYFNKVDKLTIRKNKKFKFIILIATNNFY